MKHTKRAMSCGIVAVAMAVMFAGASLSGNVTDTSQSSQQANTEVVVLASQAAALEKETKEVVQVNDESEPKTTTVATADPEWIGKAMADVKEALNVRDAASEDGELVGKLYKGSVATVVEEGTEWTMIKSGNVSGYVKTAYLVFGDDAKAFAEKECKLMLESKIGGLAVRSTPDTSLDNKIHVLEEGEKIEVNTTADSVDGWYVVTYKNTTGYVIADDTYVVKPAYEFKKALTIEEEQAAEKAKVKATKKTTKSSSKSSTKTSSTSKSSSSSSASYSDVELLAALIWCEARGESYEGQVAVGAVVLNRVESGSFPNSISKVVYQKGQFTPASSGKLKKALANGNYCMDAAQAALAGQDPTGGALYFNSGTGKGMQIGNQHFY